MQLTIDMPVVSECVVAECAYNIDKGCHARAITVGDGHSPGCDTYMGSASHTKSSRRQAGVGACKVIGCSFNDDFECSAEGIHVGFKNANVHCLTYHPR